MDVCGVCGEITFHSRNVRFETIQRMCRVLAHRGPDDMGMVFFDGDRSVESKHESDGRVENDGFEGGFGHRRLSIIDLSEAAHQPMSNEDGSLWIVFNGEIYNFQDLRTELEKKGHVFKSRSDTEVVLHAYEAWGVECLTRFRGMFAFALWDSKQQRLFAARDRLGKKPLVYVHQNGRFLFASEIKAILEAPGIERRVDPVALHYYLTYQYVPSPYTIFDGVKKLPPGHYLLYDRTGRLKIERYWKLNFPSHLEDSTSTSEWCERLRTALEESIRLRLISDVPIGVFLSGGIDSSLIVGVMARWIGHRVKTFSIGFEEKGFDELSYARYVSQVFGSEHHEFVIKPDAIGILPKLVWHYNEPFADSSAIPTYYVAKMTKDYVKVVLTGDAGDENFAGYRRYLRSQRAAQFTVLPETLRKRFLPISLRGLASMGWGEAKLHRLADFMEDLSGDPGRDYAEQIKIFNAKEKRDIYTEEFSKNVETINPLNFLLEKFDEVDTTDRLERLLYVDLMTYLPEDLLVKMDIATMANSVEARVPLLDHQFMELVAGIPSRLKLKGSEAKFILKKAFSDVLPKPISRRKKMGFAVPVSQWFRKELKDYAWDVLLDHRTLNRGYFRKDGVERLLNEHLERRYDHSAKLWALLVLEIWFRVFIDGEGDFGSQPAQQ